MADPFSVIASTVSVASAGIALSTTLYTFAETAYRADKTVKDIAQDVSLTSAVLHELGHLIEQDSKARLCSESALSTADQAIKGCGNVFTEINFILSKSLKRVGSGGKNTVSTFGKLKWPFMEKKMELLRSNLERLKTTLLLLLNVLSYARKLGFE